MSQSIKKRIVKNSVYLYIRSFITLLITLYSSRLVLQALGVESYGVYQLIGGIVAALAFLNSTITSSVQRFISYEVGKGDSVIITRTFSSIVNVMILLSLIMFVLIMIVGAFLIKTQVNIGDVSINEAMTVLLFSALTLVVTINSIPYNALLIAYEDMNVFAILDILYALLKLFSISILFLFDSNRLFLYVVFLFIATIFIRILYSIVCKRKHKESKYIYCLDKTLLKQIFSFSGWTSLSAFSYMLKTQGLSLVMNVFFGPLLNAAYGIAVQVDNALRTMFQTFQLSYSPNITKLYAANEYFQMNRLIYSGGKICTIIVLAISIPIIIDTEYVLSLWLNTMPEYAPMIIRLLLIQTIFIALGCNSNIAIQATGNVKWVEIICNIIDFIAIPISILIVYYNRIYYLPFLIMAILVFLTVMMRLFFLKKYMPFFDLSTYIKDNFLKLGGVVVLAVVFPVLIHYNYNFCLLRFFSTTILYEIIFLSLVYKICLLDNEKGILMEIWHKIKNSMINR